MRDTTERIKEARRALKITQDAFAEKIGITRNYVSMIEIGDREPSEPIIRAICREFAINYLWLTTGEGDMFSSESGDLSKIIDGLMAGENETAKAVFKALAALGGNEWEVFRRFILSAAHEIEQSEHTRE